MSSSKRSLSESGNKNSSRTRDRNNSNSSASPPSDNPSEPEEDDESPTVDRRRENIDDLWLESNGGLTAPGWRIREVRITTFKFLTLQDFPVLSLVSKRFRQYTRQWLAVVMLTQAHQQRTRALRTRSHSASEGGVEDAALEERLRLLAALNLEAVVGNPEQLTALVEFSQQIHSEEYTMAFLKVYCYL